MNIASTRVGVFLSVVAAGSGIQPERAGGSADHEHTSQMLVRLPLRFEPNVGQAPSEVLYCARGPGYGIAVAADAVVLELVRSREGPGQPARGALRLELGAVAGAEAIEPLDLQPGLSNHYRGRDPARWRTGVPGFGGLRLCDVAAGIDLVLHGSQRELEFDYEVAPGADLAAIALCIDGGGAATLRADGALALATNCGEVLLRAPVAHQLDGGEPRPVAARFVPLADGRFGFEVDARDPTLPLVIDPVVSYLPSSALDGGIDDLIWDVAINATTPSFPDERVYLTGTTTSLDFPVLNPITIPGYTGDELAGGADVFIAQLDPASCTLLYATYLGGSGNDFGFALDTDGPVYVTGSTTSADFPVWDPTGLAPEGLVYGGATDAFVIKLEPDGGVVEYSRYLGGSGSDSGRGIAVFSQEIYVAGVTTSGNFPVVNPLACAAGPAECTFTFDGGTYAGGSADAFVVKIGILATVVFGTYLGGDAADSAIGIQVVASDPLDAQVFVTGWTASSDFPATSSAFDVTFGSGITDVFVAKLSLTADIFGTLASALDYATFLGGSGSEGEVPSGWIGADVDVRPAGEAVVVFPTSSFDMPTVNALQPGYAGGSADGFVAELSPDGSSLLFATYLGGSDEDDPMAVVLDSSGLVHLAGFTRSDDFPLVDPVPGGELFSGGGTDAFAARIDTSGPALVFSTFLGTPGEDFGRGVAAGADGRTIVGGYSLGADVEPFLARITSTNTPVGSSVCVHPIDLITETTPVSVLFETVSAEGDTLLFTAPGGPPPPLGFFVCDPTSYDVLTTATSTGSIEICIDYGPLCEGPLESTLALLHFEAGVWVDITSPGYPDTTANRICGTATSLSPFAVLFHPLIPSIASIAPDHGPLSGGTSIALAGQNLASVTTVLFDGVPASFALQGDGSLQAVLPAGSAPGFVDVTVLGPGGSDVAQVAFDYFVAPVEIGEACGAPHLVWQGSPTLGETLLVTTEDLGSLNQTMLVDVFDGVLEPPIALALLIAGSSGGCSASPCPMWVVPDFAFPLGNAASYEFAIPDDPALLGVVVRLQARMRGCPRLTTQALEFVIGP